MARPGRLVLVVGPSGAGKDTLIAAAKARLAGDLRFDFPRRVVTRAAMAELEDHDSIEPAHFESERQRGAYALSWEAHGLSYGIPAGIDNALADGRTVVVNVSRRIVAEALAAYPNGLVLLVAASPQVRATRLAARGRESAADIGARLKREGAALPAGIVARRIDNSGALEAGIAVFIAALQDPE